MRFGLYLLHEDLINADQLVAALEAQQDCLPPLGQIALEQGKLTAIELFSVVRLQSDLPHEYFGDLAIELGLLSRREVAELLLIQADRKRPLHEILVDQGSLNEVQAQAALESYRERLEHGEQAGRERKAERQRFPLSSPQMAFKE